MTALDAPSEVSPGATTTGARVRAVRVLHPPACGLGVRIVASPSGDCKPAVKALAQDGSLVGSHSRQLDTRHHTQHLSEVVRESFPALSESSHK